MTALAILTLVAWAFVFITQAGDAEAVDGLFALVAFLLSTALAIVTLAQ